MSAHFDAESRRADRLAKRQRDMVRRTGALASVAMAGFWGPIAFVYASDWTLGPRHTERGLIWAAAIAAPCLLLGIWAWRSREPKLAPYLLLMRSEAGERSIIREYPDDYTAANHARSELTGPGSSVTVARGLSDDALPLGIWTEDHQAADWQFLIPEWSFHSALRRRR